MRDFFTSKRISEHLDLIYEAYCDTQSLTIGLVIGEKAAAVIDSGLGAVQGLRAYAQTLTDKPLICLATHGHPDHAGGAVQFDRAYLNPRDEPELAWGLTRERRLGDLRDFSDHDDEVCAYAEAHCVDCTGARFEPLRDGDVFDLGGVRLEILEMPGHTQGSVAIINRAEQYIFTGDAVSETLMVTGYQRSCMEESYGALRRLVEIGESMPDLRLYAAHYPQPIPLQMAVDLRDACGEILAGQTQDDERTHFKFAELNDPDIELMKHVKNGVGVTYNLAAFRSSPDGR